MIARQDLRPIACLLAFGVLACAASTVAAQDDALSLRDLARKGGTIRGWSRAPITGENKKVFDDYFSRYYFPEMAKTDAASLSNLAKMRTDLFELYIWPSHPSVQSALTEKVYDFASRAFNAGQAPPPLRYNAVLMLGDLDETYPTKDDPSAVPYAKANRLLCLIIKNRDKVPAYIEVGALVGLQRHAKHVAALGATEKLATYRMLLEAVDQQEFPPGTSREVQNWIRLQAAEGIANLGTAGTDGECVRAVAKLVGDPSVDLPTRSAAAALLKRMPMTGLPPAVVTEVVGAVKGLSCAVGRAERREAERFVELQRSQSRGPDADSSARFQMGVDGWVYDRGSLIPHLEQVHRGLSAVEPIAGDDASAIASIAAAVRSTIDAAKSTTNIDLDVTDRIEDMADKIDELAGCNAEPSETPAEEAGDEAVTGDESEAG